MRTIPNSEMPDIEEVSCGIAKCTCVCGMQFESLAKVQFQPEMDLLAQNPCPFCGSHKLTDADSPLDWFNPQNETPEARAR